MRSGTTDTHSSLEEPRARRALVPEKRVFALLGGIAALALAAAALVTWLVSPGVVPSYASSAKMITSGNVVSFGGEDTSLDLPKRPVEMLPDFLIGYETTARQWVPGADKNAAEAVYQTLSMNLDMLTKVSTYARVTGYADSEAARRGLGDVMSRFPVGGADVMLGGTLVKSGYSSDRGAYVMAWVRGPYVTYVKSFFKDNVPAQKRDFLYRETSRIARGVDVFQRTGKQGVEGNAATSRGATASPAPAPAPAGTGAGS